MWILADLVPPVGFFTIAGAIAVCMIGYYVFTKLGSDVNVTVRDFSKTHNWTSIKITAKAWYCSICEAFLIHGIGVYCDCCGVCADPECVKKANQSLPCKIITSNTEIQLHHWVKGNLPLGAVCFICNKDCSLEPGLIDFQCCWCQRTVHTNCKIGIEEICDFGPYRSMIVPPSCVQVVRRKGALNKHLLLRAVGCPNWQNWSPLVVVANKKAGNSDGVLILSEFRRYLNPAQVIDLTSRKPPAALQWCVLFAPKVIRVLVAGGDGTISWVLTSSHKLDLDPEPLLVIIPLGTGNDLSRVLGWGKENSSQLDVPKILSNIEQATLSHLDRWQIEVITTRHLGIRIPNKTLYMYNYLSVGVDAQVALSFHKTRDSAFYIYGSRMFNKLLYLCFGTQQVVTADCKNLEQRLDLYLDGSQIQLPELESIVVLNISSWGAGVNLWGLGDGSTKTIQSHQDGILEVVGIYSSFHIAQIQVGLSAPIRLGQAKLVEIRLKEKAPVQIDGEPWEQNPGILKITYVNKCPVLVNYNDN
ncbi:hypothetical protein ABEB36_014060 [Hypothenemus hampei]